MKKGFRAALLAAATLGIGAIAIAGVAVSRRSPMSVSASGDSQYSATSLPTKTIDLNPVTEVDVRSYYSSLAGHNYQGEDLLKALKPILKNGQKYHNYDSGNAIWQMYEITDRDWTLSPAEEITNGTYNSETKIITNYSYGESSSKKDNPYLHLLYRNHSEPASRIRAWDHHGDNNGIDREHVWPKSRGFGKKDGEEQAGPGARGDIHHLLPGDSYVNSETHSNNSYGFVNMDTVTNNAGEKYKIDGKTVVAGNYRGTSLTFGKTLGNQEVFEPQDCDKGDIARACFYMVARYNNLAGGDTIDVGNPNLFLEDTVDTTTIFSTAESPVSLGILRDLLAWHKLDPVDEYEIHRNDIIYRNYAKNRNPFIDFPEWVDYIWGTVEYANDNRTITARHETPTGTADPETDVFHGYHSEGITSITATVSKSFLVGSIITKTDITLRDNFENEITDYDFPDYQFTYEDASSGGEASNKEFTIEYQGLSTTLSIPLARTPYIEPDDNVESLTSDGDFSGVQGTGNSSAQDNSIEKDGVTYSATSSYLFNNAYLSVKTNYYETIDGKSYFRSPSVISNVTRYNTAIKSVDYELYNGGTLTSDPTFIQYSPDNSAWSETPSGRDHFFKITFVGSFRGYVNFDSITVTLAGDETANNVANFIMYEDTANQCSTKFDEASILFENMDVSNRNIFMTSSNYVLSEARDRLEAWALNQGKSIIHINGDYVIQSNGKVYTVPEQRDMNNATIIVAFIVAVSFVSGGFYFYLSHKEE